VEYWLAPFGDRFGGILDQIEAMEKELEQPGGNYLIPG
jgi:hypothetical protein